MKPVEPLPVKLVCGILFSDTALAEQALLLLSELYGRVDYKSPLYPFDCTDYYVAEMGSPIFRQFVSFQEVISPSRLAKIKLECNDIEERLAVDGQRKVNLDPGYMDYDKFVLASAKYNAHKIYLDVGIYADLTLRYERGHYKPSDYAFPDFKSGLYDEAFLHIRARFKGQLRRILKIWSVSEIDENKNT
jgi:hypothetical protein